MSETRGGNDKDRDGNDKDRDSRKTHSGTPPPRVLVRVIQTAREEKSKAHQIYLEVQVCGGGNGGKRETWPER